LGAKIKDMKYDVHDSVIYYKSEASILIQWELYDKSKREVIYNKQTTGTSTLGGKVTAKCIFASFRVATRNLLADELFVENLTQQQELKTQFEAPHKTILIDKVPLLNSQNIKEILNRAIESVITIKAEYGFASGFIISKMGYLITTHHVIEGKNFTDVILPNGLTLQAEIVQVNQDYDLALLKIKGSGFKPLPIGDSHGLIVGEEVFAIGTPVHPALGQSVSRGIISGKRELRKKELIQTDVKIDPGNSGGPIINAKGEIVGIVTWKIVGRGYEGLAFCIPINAAKEKLGIKIKPELPAPNDQTNKPHNARKQIQAYF
jgi:S1-C subfamily serine protease